MSDFYGPDFEQNVIDLLESTQAMQISEFKAFVDRWGKEAVTVPASYIDYSSLYSELRRDYPELVNSEWEPFAETEELAGVFGSITEPFIDWVNLSRRLRLRQAINAYTSIGYLQLSLDEHGNEKYIIDEEKDIRPDLREGIVKIVEAYSKF